MLHTLRFSLQNADYFIMLRFFGSCIIHILQRTLRPIYRTGVPLPSRCCILYIIFTTNISTECFKYASHSPFFSSKCRLFHNATFFASYIIHILQRTLHPIYRTDVPLPSRCCILYIFFQQI